MGLGSPGVPTALVRLVHVFRSSHATRNYTNCLMVLVDAPGNFSYLPVGELPGEFDDWQTTNKRLLGYCKIDLKAGVVHDTMGFFNTLWSPLGVLGHLCMGCCTGEAHCKRRCTIS